jgi:hypothetical protein
LFETVVGQKRASAFLDFPFFLKFFLFLTP